MRSALPKNFTAFVSIVVLAAILALWPSAPSSDSEYNLDTLPYSLADLCQTREQHCLVLALLDDLGVEYQVYGAYSELHVSVADRQKLSKHIDSLELRRHFEKPVLTAHSVYGNATWSEIHSMETQILERKVYQAIKMALGRELVVSVQLELRPRAPSLVAATLGSRTGTPVQPAHQPSSFLVRQVPKPPKSFEVKRLSVFVLIDVPGEDDRAAIRGFVEHTVGFFEARGDTVYVNNSAWSDELKKIAVAPQVLTRE